MSARSCAWLVLAALCLSATAGAAIPGDVNLDCKIDTADTLVLSGTVMGAINLNAEQQDAADVAPIVSGASAPDGMVTIADLVVLLRAVAGLQALPGGINVPTISSPFGDLTENPITVTGVACPGDVVTLYVNNRIRGSVVAAADRSFAFPLIGIQYDANTLKAKATAYGETSAFSNQLSVNNTSASIPTTNPQLGSGAITVWPPPRGGGHYELTTANFVIPSGKTLILPAWTVLRFQGGNGPAAAGLEVAGRLLVQGGAPSVAGSPDVSVTFQKLSSSRWEGILITAGTGSLIEHAFITGASNSLTVTGSGTSATLRESELYDFDKGVTASAGASVIVDGSYIHYGSTVGTGIGIVNANLTVTDSLFFNIASGIDVSGSSFATIGPNNVFRTLRTEAIRIEGPADGLIIDNEIDARENAAVLAARAQWGINLVNSSPEIRANDIYGAETGIRVAGSSNPLITDGNDIHHNIWGIWLEGSGSDSVDELTGSPHPIITGNSIHDNSGDMPASGTPPSKTRDYCSFGVGAGANLCISDYPSGSSVFIDARGNYWGSNNPTTIRNSIRDPDTSTHQLNGNQFFYNSVSDPVAIDLSNYRATANGGPGSTPLFYNIVTGVSHSPQVIAPTLGEALSIQFYLVTPSDVTVNIFEEDTPGNVKRTLLAPALGIGPHTIVWNGKDGSGNFVADEAYAYAISTTIAGITDVFNPPLAPIGSKLIHLVEETTPFPGSYDIYRNEPLKILFDVEYAPGRVRVNRVLEGNPAEIVTLVNFAPFAQMNKHLFVYDGFDPAGNFLGPAQRKYYFHPDPIKRNAVIVHRTAPQIVGLSYVPPPPVPGDAQAPAIEVKGDPYLVRLSYDQLSRISFCIDQAAYLTVKILKPERGNPDIAADVVATLLQDTTTPHAAQNCNAGGTPYVVEWDGTAPASGDPYMMQPVEDGSYTFTIEARNALQTNLRSIYRGIVQTRQ